MNYQKFSLLFGLSVWFFATLVVRLWGDAIFVIENSFLLIALFIGAIPVLYILIMSVFNQYKLYGDTRLRSVVLMSVPGMICDVICVKFHSIVFPKLTIEQSVVMAAWVIWVYAIVLLVGLFRSVNKTV